MWQLVLIQIKGSTNVRYELLRAEASSSVQFVAMEGANWGDDWG
jgi:hypothetical protein